MDQKTVDLMEKFECFFRSIAGAIKLSKEDPLHHQLNPDGIEKMCQENQKLGKDWLETHADFLKGTSAEFHYIVKTQTTDDDEDDEFLAEMELGIARMELEVARMEDTKIYYCVVCRTNIVGPYSGQDTCYECLLKQ